MNLVPAIASEPSPRLSDEGRARLLSQPGEPLFLAAWKQVLFIHFEVDAAVLSPAIPFELDLYQDRAYVSLVAFTMRDLRPRRGGHIAAGMFKLVAAQRFLNVRTYVRHHGERGIYFITEWLSDWLSVQLGPWLYGLPYRFAKVDYRYTDEEGYAGMVEAANGDCFQCLTRAEAREPLVPCKNGSRDEFLLERYTAYTRTHSIRRRFRIWHPPWPQKRVRVSITSDTLLQKTWPWFREAQPIGANYSPGFDEVWMGRAALAR